MPIDMNEDTISNLLNPDKSPYPDYFNQRRAEGHYRIVSPGLALVLVLQQPVAPWSDRCGGIPGRNGRMLMIVGSIISISALVSSRSLATSMPATVPLLYASHSTFDHSVYYADTAIDGPSEIEFTQAGKGVQA